MAIGRGRSNKRSSSSSSYIPTVSTVIFIGLCFFGVWMLSSSFVPRQATTSISTSTSNPGFIKSEQRQSRDPPAFDDTPGDLPEDAVKGDGDKSKDTISTTNYDEKLQEEKQSVLEMPGRRSDPITNTRATITDTAGNGDGEIQQQEKSSVEDGKKNNDATNEEKDQSFSSSTEENRQTQERRDSVEDGEQKKQEIQEESNENQQQNQEAQEVIIENHQVESAHTNAETEETQPTREEESNGNQDQQQKTEMESEERTHEQNQQDTEVDHGQESQQQQNSETTNNEGDSIHGDQQNSESGIREVTTEETQQQEEKSSSESQKTDEEHPQQNEQGESTSASAENQETQQQQQQQQQQHQSESESGNTGSENQESQQSETESTPSENQEPQQQSKSETHESQQQSESENHESQQQQQSESDSTASEIENQETQQQSEKESNSLVENQEEPQQSDQRENEREVETGTKQENNEAEITGEVKGDSKMGIPKESKESKREWSTQATQSENEKERRKESESDSGKSGSINGYTWQQCNVTAGTDYIPCLDNVEALKHLHTTGHFEHRERHCPEEGPTCLVPLPEGYKSPIEWPSSRDKIWYHNVPHTKLAEVKGHQNWVKVTGEFLTFPGGGTQFIHGALHYIDFIQKSVPRIGWGKHTRVILDVGCGVASFGGYLFDRDVLTMSFAPKDEHEAQVQFALERGIPAISAVMGTQRLPFPSRVFDLIHCARCRVLWHAEGGRLLLELNRVLRPGGFFVWSATPVYQKLKEDVEIWEAMTSLTLSMCWDLYAIKKDKLNGVAAAIYRKPISNECYDNRKHKSPPMCKNKDDPNAAWYVPLQSCMHRVPIGKSERGSRWPEDWPNRVQKAPYWLNNSQMGIYGNPAPDDFTEDYTHWKEEVNKLYLTGLGINWPKVRNIMDMRAVYGGFAAALKDHKVWVMNVVNVDSPDTLPIIYERGLFGIYHDWCESFSTYPRTYDLLHADHLFSKLKKR
ncbi:probable methyltransferase PMT27 isoform X2 [Macadamia integrifolia]|nr:probable methyltransferase PMT27 isoform X2 [Macadamia integrifolia]